MRSDAWCHAPGWHGCGCQEPPRPPFVWPHCQQKSALHSRQCMCEHPPFFSISTKQLGHGFTLSPTGAAGACGSPCRAMKARRSAHAAGQCGASAQDKQKRVPHDPHVASMPPRGALPPRRTARTTAPHAAFGQYASIGWASTAASARRVISDSRAGEASATRSSASGATAAMMAIRPRTRTRRGAARAADAESQSRRRLLKHAAPVPTRHSI